MRSLMRNQWVRSLVYLKTIAEMALRISLKGFPTNLLLDTFLGVRLPQPTVLFLNFLHSLHKQRIHAATLSCKTSRCSCRAPGIAQVQARYLRLV